MNSIPETTKNDTTTPPTDDLPNVAGTRDGRAASHVAAPGWLPTYGYMEPNPADIESDGDDFTDAARSLLVHLGEARACYERLHGYWLNRDSTYPGDGEIAALVSRHTFALHNVTKHLELLRVYREEERKMAVRRGRR